MVGEDKILMSVKELQRLHMIHQVIEKRVTQEKAGELLGFSDRQIRRMIKRVREEGDGGVTHRSRGRRSNRAMGKKIKARVLKVYRAMYGDFGPTLASEMLAERDKIRINDETLRLWLLEAGVDHFKRRKRPHRQWRERKGHVGELLQMDGSHHAWFEGRGPICTLMAYIDDASSRVYARFYEYEGTIPAMDSFKRYALGFGLPWAVYADKHSTYKSQGEPTISEQLAGEEPMSQFQRSLSELGVEMIHAHSPQAKGRIERFFKTFQDRVVKEMRLAGISTIECGNRFLDGYLPIYNRRFSVAPAQAVDLHKPIPKGLDLNGVLCIKTGRAFRNDGTVAHNCKLYQVESFLRTKRVTVEERCDGTMRITNQGKRLRYREITFRPVRIVEAPKIRLTRPPMKPAPDHPWRKTFTLKEKKTSISQP